MEQTALPFDKSKQFAILGHYLQNEKFFVQVKDRLEPGWFVEPYCTKVSELKQKFWAEFKRAPTESEVKNHRTVLLMDQGDRNLFYETMRLAGYWASEFPLDALVKELTEWMHSRILFNSIREAGEAYNRHDLSKASRLIESAVQEIRGTTFDDVPAEAWDGYMRDFEKSKEEYSNALTTGLKTFDRLLTPKASKGSLLVGDMSIVLASTNSGKCLGKNEPVIMADGSVRLVQDVKKGEHLMGPDGLPRLVLSTTSGRGPLFRIVPKSGGSSWVCNDVHVLSLKSATKNRRCTPGQVVNLPLDQYHEMNDEFKLTMRLWRSSLSFSERRLPVDPYVLGMWIGDGHSDRAALTTMDSELAQEWGVWLRSMGDEVSVYSQDGNKAKTYAAAMIPQDGAICRSCDLPARSQGWCSTHYVAAWRKGEAKERPQRQVLRSKLALRALGVLNNKRIPHKYLTSSRKQRLEILAGIVDTDGYVFQTGLEISTVSPGLAEDYAYLCRSLGFKVSVCVRKKSIKSTGFVGEYFILGVRGKLSEIPVRLKRKRGIDCKKDPSLSGFRVEALGVGDYYGFTLGGDHLFLLGDFTVTHNTTSMITVANANVMELEPTLFITHEGRPSDIKEKIWCNMLDVSPQLLLGYRDQAGNKQPGLYETEEGRKRIDFHLRLMGRYLTYVPYNKAGLSVEEVASMIRRKQDERISKFGQGYRLLVVDYPAKLTTELAAKGNMQRRSIDEHVYNYFEQLGLELGMHVLCAIQTNREGSKVNKGLHGEDRLLTTEDVMESWGPMTSATNVWSINADPRAKANKRLTYYVDKSRSSETGWAIVCRTNFNHAITHSNTLGCTYYRGASTYADKIDHLLDQYIAQGTEIPQTTLAA